MHDFYRCLATRTVGGLLTFAALSAPTFAQDVPQNERLAYSMMVGGLHVGDAVVSLSQDSDSYTTSLKLTAGGVAKWVREFRADLSGEGTFTTKENVATPLPSSYRRDWSGSEIDSSLLMTYDPATRLTSTKERYIQRETGEELSYDELPWNKNDRGRDKKKPVPENQRAGAMDPMAGFIAARHQVMAQGASKTPIKFRVPVYDGQRRYDIVATTSAPRGVTINDKPYTVITVNTTLVPVAGFSERGEERMRESRGKILFTADERFIPVQVTIENDLLSGVMNLKGDCNVTPEACAPTTQEAKSQ
ncbi:MAG: DUF3108 domain-containing protein [Proteobacteria bacterium]|nr:DUF3108 domain-containing protein [Pseudomonadota bacterium]